MLALRLGFPDEGTLPETRTERRAYDLVADGFGPGSNGPLVIAVDISEDPGVVEPLLGAIAADEGIAAVAPPRSTPTPAWRRWSRSRPPRPQDEATLDTIERLRADVLPSVLDGRPARGPRRRPDGDASPTSATGSTIGCRCSSPPWSCCRSCC